MVPQEAKAQPAQPRSAHPAAIVPQAQQAQAPAFKCPKAGTIIEITTSAQIGVRISLGVDASDPTLCRSKVGSAISELYYGLYSRAVSADGLAELRQGLADLFAGRREQFAARFQSPTTGGGRLTFEDTWRRLGSETIVIADRQVAAVAFERAQRNLDGIFQGVEKYLYDPATGVWVKRMAVSGGHTSQNWAVNWEVTKIVEPGS